MNRVYLSETAATPLTQKELADAANKILPRPVLTEWDFDEANPKSRLSGDGHCDCCEDGEFVLLPEDDPDVRAGEKRYMKCRKCGCWSHL